MRPERHVELLEHPACLERLGHELVVLGPGRLLACLFERFVDDLFGFVGLPRPAHIAVLVGFRLGESDHVGLQVDRQSAE